MQTDDRFIKRVFFDDERNAAFAAALRDGNHVDAVIAQGGKDTA